MVFFTLWAWGIAMYAFGHFVGVRTAEQNFMMRWAELDEIEGATREDRGG